ncbi:MAG: LemA family protein [Bacteroidales bacterium]|nr:LemA family protein [Bacteroidales bacterium]
MTLIIIIAIIAILVVWVVSVQNRLVKNDEFCNNAIKQISVQQTSRFDALETAVKIAREENAVEGENYEKIIGMRRPSASANPTVEEINATETALGGFAARLMAVAEAYPQLKGAEAYQKAMDKYFEYEDTVRVSRITFNDTVTKYNRDVRAFPGSVVASMLGFPLREYLADRPEKADLPQDLFKK